MKRLWSQTYLAAVLSTGTIALGQEPERDIAGQIAEAFQVARDSLGHQNYSAAISKKLLKEHPKEVLEALKLYQSDAVPAIRRGAYRFVYSIGRSSRDPQIRQEVTWRLVNACNDPEAWQMTSRFLLSFEEEDFTPASKAVLHELLTEDPPKGSIIWIIGIAGMREELPRLKSLLIDESLYETRPHAGKWYGTVSWHARLARARMGVEEDTLRAIELVEQERSHSRVTLLLKHLAYTRQPAAFVHIATYLDSDERLPRVKVTAPGTLYAHRAMGILAEALPGFPIKRTRPPYTQDQIERAREWMKTHSWEPND